MSLAGGWKESTRADVLMGAMAGLGATAPMTVVMELLYRRLPRGDRAPLPPASITARVSARAGHPWPALLRERPATPPQWTWLTLAGHFAYGAVAGAMYGPVTRRLHLPPFAGGAGFGVLVWLVSYLGWLPIAGLFPPASTQGAARNGLMIAAHLVWGGALGLLLKGFQVYLEAFPFPLARWREG